ncbi:MAG TPA: nuclear transport factor 2 family protein [Glycomyces sp.]|nr:nuclear transport factor 2 family protein [Glycomyces sp.]
MTALTEYIEAWVANDADRIARAVAPECVIAECYGPVYRGRDTVRRWARTWFGAGGIVHRWTITDHIVTGEREAAEWVFECTWEGGRHAFDGATVARSAGGLMLALREYQTTAPLYDWDGDWR